MSIYHILIANITVTLKHKTMLLPQYIHLKTVHRSLFTGTAAKNCFVGHRWRNCDTMRQPSSTSAAAAPITGLLPHAAWSVSKT